MPFNPNWSPDGGKWININSAEELSVYRILTSKKGVIRLRVMNEYGEWVATVDVDASVFSGNPLVGFTNVKKIVFPQMDSMQTLKFLGVFMGEKIWTILPLNNRVKVEHDHLCVFAEGDLTLHPWEEA